VLQVRDDVENVSDRLGARGKDFGSDIIEGKPTLLLGHVLGAASAAEREELVALIGPRADPATAGTDAQRIDRVVALMEHYGSVDYACAFADGLAGGALAEFDAAMGWLPPSDDKDFVRSLVLFLRDPLIRGR
jgi:geranylgeranyl pyrophosphate synthase